MLSNDQGIKAICLYYGGKDHWRKCYNDIWKWKQIDPAFAEAYESYKIKMNKQNASGGRKKLSEKDPDWIEKFCEAYIKFRNPRKAAEVTPYSFQSLMRMTDPNDSQYNEEFTKSFKIAGQEISADLEQIALDAAYLIGEGVTSLTQDEAKILDIQSRISLNTLSKLNPARFGKKLEMQVSGKIDHTHSISGRAVQLTSLMEEQRLFMQERASGRSLPMALPPAPEAIDVEYEELEMVKVESE